MNRLSSDSYCKTRKKRQESHGSMAHAGTCASRESGEGLGCPAGDQGLGTIRAPRGQPSKAPRQGTGGQKGDVTPSHHPISSCWQDHAPPCPAVRCESGEEADVPGWVIPLSPQISGTPGFPPGEVCCAVFWFFPSAVSHAHLSQ